MRHGWKSTPRSFRHLVRSRIEATAWQKARPITETISAVHMPVLNAVGKAEVSRTLAYGARVLCLAVLYLAAGLGCSLFTDPGGYRLPPPDMSLDPEAIRLPSALFFCGRWRSAGPPDDEFVLVDIRMRAMTGRERAIIKLHGGQVLYTFHASGRSCPSCARSRLVRAWVPTASIPMIHAASGYAEVRLVEDPRRYDVNIGVTYRRPHYASESMRNLIENLGGVVYYDWPELEAVAAVLPDWSVRWLAADPNILHVDYSGVILCGN